MKIRDHDADLLHVLEHHGGRRAQRVLQRALCAGSAMAGRRVRDPAREVELADEPLEPALEARLRADPGDHDAALVYADWYQQRGHPRGALIAVQAARARDPDDPALAAEEPRAARRPRRVARLPRPAAHRLSSKGSPTGRATCSGST